MKSKLCSLMSLIISRQCFLKEGHYERIWGFPFQVLYRTAHVTSRSIHPVDALSYVNREYFGLYNTCHGVYALTFHGRRLPPLAPVRGGFFMRILVCR